MTDVVLKLKPSERRLLVKELRDFAEMPAEGGICDPLIEVMHKLSAQAADEIENLAERLEVSHVWQMVPGGTDLERVDAPDSLANWDGIACRDVTIKMLKGGDGQ